MNVYVIASDAGHVKVGISNDPPRRMMSLQAATAANLTLAHIFPTTEAGRIERAAHRILADSRIKGEWFASSIEDAIAAIQEAGRNSDAPPLVIEPPISPIMTPHQYRAALDSLGLTQGTAAEFLGISIRSAHGYANGDPIPEPIAKLLRLMIRLGLTPEDVK